MEPVAVARRDSNEVGVVEGRILMQRDLPRGRAQFAIPEGFDKTCSIVSGLDGKFVTCCRVTKTSFKPLFFA
jgi:hypothetical protein